MNITRNEWIAVGISLALIGFFFFQGNLAGLFGQKQSDQTAQVGESADNSGDTRNQEGSGDAAAPTPTPTPTPTPSGTSATEDKGLKIQDIVVGTGEAAKQGDKLSVHYVGKLVDGKVFDSSREDNKPIELTLGAGRVIPGWEKGLEGLKVGGKRILIIPPELAYGEQGSPPFIPPNSTLIFDVELVAIKK